MSSSALRSGVRVFPEQNQEFPVGDTFEDFFFAAYGFPLYSVTLAHLNQQQVSKSAADLEMLSALREPSSCRLPPDLSGKCGFCHRFYWGTLREHFAVCDSYEEYHFSAGWHCDYCSSRFNIPSLLLSHTLGIDRVSPWCKLCEKHYPSDHSRELHTLYCSAQRIIVLRALFDQGFILISKKKLVSSSSDNVSLFTFISSLLSG